MHLRLVRVALLAALAVTIPASPASGATNLGAFWHFDESSGTTAADSSANHNNGTIVGATSIPGRFVRGLTFDGVDDKVAVPRSDSLEPANVTVEGWLRAPSSPGQYKHIVAQGSSFCGSAAYGLYTGAGGGLIFYIARVAWDYTLSPDAGVGIWDGAWHHVAGTFDGSTVRLYVDGVEVGSGTPTNLAIGYPAEVPDMFLGGFGTDCISDITNQNLNYTGDLDEPRIWRRPLSAEELSASAAMGGPATTRLAERLDSTQAIAYTAAFSNGNNIKISIESATGTEQISSIRLQGILPGILGLASCRNDLLGLLFSQCDIALSNGGKTAAVTVRKLNVLTSGATLRVRLSSGRTFDVAVNT